jgi:hypothetical protein
VHGDGVWPNEAVVGFPPDVRFGVRAEDIPLCGFVVCGRGIRAGVFAGVAPDAAGPEGAVAVVADGIAGPGVGAAVPGTGAAVPSATFVDAVSPDIEFCPFGAGLLGMVPAGQGVAVWPAARTAEIRNNHVMFAINFMKPPMECCRLRFDETRQCLNVVNPEVQIHIAPLACPVPISLCPREKTTQEAKKSPTNKRLGVGWKQLACHKPESVYFQQMTCATLDAVKFVPNSSASLTSGVCPMCFFTDE